MAELRQIKRVRAADSIFVALRHAILEHDFLPGERLDIQWLAKKFDVSPTPVKNALHALASTGLVEIKPRSGTFVVSLTAADVAETFDIRRALECLAAESAVRNVNDAAIRQLSSLMDKMQHTRSVEEHTRYNTEFHRTLMKLAGNRRLLDVYDDLNAHLRIARIHSTQQNWLSRVANEHAEHAEILEAIKKPNLAELQQALTRHISRAKEMLTRDLREAER
jgi:DNA-binding GntR family transcriptional regulator